MTQGNSGKSAMSGRSTTISIDHKTVMVVILDMKN